MTIPTLETLNLAHKVANHANTLGALQVRHQQRPCINHLGAIMADAVLQSGVNYRTVVYPRVAAILEDYPNASTLSGVNAIIHSARLQDFLRWKHAEKLGRFRKLASYFDKHDVETLDILRDSFDNISFRAGLLELPGIGPKTVDYLGCLAGIDTIAVDRHIKTFARESGVAVDDYESLRTIFSYAADFLKLSRREFDAWVWKTISYRGRAS